jgi:hypothetical protein
LCRWFFLRPFSNDLVLRQIKKLSVSSGSESVRVGSSTVGGPPLRGGTLLSSTTYCTRATDFFVLT